MDKVNTLCVVDDDEIFRFLTGKLLQDTDMVEDVKMFSNGQQVMDFLKQVKDDPEQVPDIMLLDLTMPVMDGWQVLEDYARLKSGLGKQITIYLVSSSIAPDDLKRAKNIEEVTDFIVKPVTEENIREILEK